MSAAGRRIPIPTLAVIVWLVLNIAGLIYAGATRTDFSGVAIAADYQVYAGAGARSLTGAPVYDLTPGRMTTNLTYRYHPAFLLPVAALIQLPYAGQILVWYTLVAAGYIAGVLVWLRLLTRLGFTYWHLLPLFVLIAYDWIGNLSYGNVGPALVLLSGGLMWAVLTRRIAVVGALAAVILVIKPQWCFPLLYALAIRDDRGFVRMVAAAVVGYLAVSAAFALAVGVERGLTLLGEYVQFVTTLGARYPWRGTEVMFDTYQNSIYQTWLRYGADSAFAAIGTAIAQIGLAAAWIVMLWHARATVSPGRALRVTLGGYILLMCLLPQLEEGLLLGIVAAALWTVYAPSRVYVGYALLQFALLAGIATGIYALRLPAVIPVNLIMMLILFYGVWVGTQNEAPQSDPLFKAVNADARAIPERK